MEMIMKAENLLLTGTVIVLGILVILSIIRSVLGPRITDRIIAVNMTGTMVIAIIAVLSVFLDENYLVDVCLIYAMISFLSVVVLCKVYTGVYLQKKHMRANLEAVEANLNRQGLGLEIGLEEHGGVEERSLLEDLDKEEENSQTVKKEENGQVAEKKESNRVTDKEKNVRTEDEKNSARTAESGNSARVAEKEAVV